ncbi:MAG: hypothetical protein WA063_03270, partial [Minisyncoccia bacterium]
MLGGPSFGQVNGLIKEFRAPAGQLNLCLKILQETDNVLEIQERLAEEYMAIVLALKEMDINFYITYSKSEMVYKKLLSVCKKRLRIKLMGLPANFPPHLASYPRDMFTILENGTILVSAGIGWAKTKERDNCQIISSPYGEGGRALACGDSIFVAERLLDDNVPMAMPRTEVLEQLGLRVGLFPLPIAGTLSRKMIESKFLLNDHLDRIACLIQGKAGKLYLVVDPGIYTGRITERSWQPCEPKESLSKIRNICEKMGIELCCPDKIEVPYIFNLVQFPDGRILMSSGCNSAYKLIADIVGEEKITITEIPIRYLP